MLVAVKGWSPKTELAASPFFQKLATAAGMLLLCHAGG